MLGVEGFKLFLLVCCVSGRYFFVACFCVVVFQALGDWSLTFQFNGSLSWFSDVYLAKALFCVVLLGSGVNVLNEDPRIPKP